MKKVAVVGVGETKFSGPQEKTEVELFAEAAMEAIVESNLKPKDIKALFVGNVLGDFAEGQGMVQAFAAENIGCLYVPANKYEGACASASMAIRDAFMGASRGRPPWARDWQRGPSPCSATPATNTPPALRSRPYSPC
jgi:acetyl-CoA C-acetyltransferase